MKIGVMLRSISEDQGTGIYTRNLLAALLEADRDDRFVLIYRNRRYGQGFAHLPQVVERVVSAPGKLLWDQVAVARLAAREQIDLLFNPKFTIPLLAHCKTVIAIHGASWFVHPEMYKRLDLAYVRLMIPRYCARADGIISNSELTTRDYIHLLKVPPRKILTVHLAASRIFRPVTDVEELKRVRQRYLLPDRYALFVGKLYPGKNFGRLVEAFARLSGRIHPPLRLVAVGDTRWKCEQDFRRVEEFGLDHEILFTGWVPQLDLPAIFSQAEMFILPSLYEEFGIPVVEAMASGCPVVASRTGALPEVTAGAAVLVDPLDPDSIAEAVAALAGDSERRRDLAAAGLRRARHFSWEKAAQATIEVFGRVYRGESPAPSPEIHPPADGDEGRSRTAA